MGTALDHRPRDLRERILDATLQVICQRGMARTRTSAIARAAGCSEGSIYRYFAGKPELFQEVLRTRLSSLLDALPGLPMRAGSATVEANLAEVARAALSFYGEVVPLYAGLYADSELLADQRSQVVGGDLSPNRAVGGLADYLRAEQRLGRVRPQADPVAVARLVFSSCLGESFFCALLDGRLDEVDREQHASALAALLASELEPEGAAR